MARITVDIEKMRQAADELHPPAQELPEKGARLFEATNLENFDPRYAAQLSAKVRDEGAYAQSEANRCAEQFEAFSQRLRDIAQRFEAADLETCQDMEAAYAALQEAIAAQAETPFAPDWLIKGLCPPWLELWAWLDMTPAQREQEIETYRLDWAKFLASRTAGSFREPQQDTAYLEEMFQIYLFGLPPALFDPKTGQQVRPYVSPDNLELFNKPNLPDGAEVYLDPKTRRPRFGLHQYQDLPEYYRILERAGELDGLGLADLPEGIEPEKWASKHHNLCGLDAVGHATGAEDMFQTYVAYAGMDEAMLIDGDMMWTHEVRDLYQELGWEAQDIGPFEGSQVHWNEDDVDACPTLGQVEEKLGRGYVITALVGVDRGTGFLSAAESSTGHFVNILETMETRDGTDLVRVYNSMHHREEIYTWEQFDTVWRKAGGNSGGQGVIAKPPETGD